VFGNEIRLLHLVREPVKTRDVEMASPRPKGKRSRHNPAKTGIPMQTAMVGFFLMIETLSQANNDAGFKVVRVAQQTVPLTWYLPLARSADMSCNVIWCVK
jgi:hypothetical protein